VTFPRRFAQSNAREVTNKVFFDIEIDGEAAGECRQAGLDFADIRLRPLPASSAIPCRGVCLLGVLVVLLWRDFAH
jgi:hypothetical protein